MPAGHAVLLLISGLVVAAIESSPAGTHLAALGDLVFRDTRDLGGLAEIAAVRGMQPGAGRRAGPADRRRGCSPWIAAASAAICPGALLGVLGVLAGLSSGRMPSANAGSWPDCRARPRARNVVLIVWDTVRSYNLGPLRLFPGHDPQPGALGAEGRQVQPRPRAGPVDVSLAHVLLHRPVAVPAEYAVELQARCPVPTLAEYLASRGYQTAGFSANTNCCTYETGLDRGFAHFEDYALTATSLLTRTVPGKWMLEEILSVGDVYG